MNASSADTAVIIVCGLAMLAVMTVAQAQTLNDPTRPPASIEKPATDASEVKTAAGLQTVILRSDAKPAAIINGEYVVLGGRVGDARLVKVSEDSVTLKSASGSETLRLIPGIEKAPVFSAEAGEKKAKGKVVGKEAKK